MESKSLIENLKKYKLIAAVKEPKAIESAVKYKENIGAVILMTGTVLTAKKYVDYLQSNGLAVILHVEKIGGLQMDHDGIDFIKRYIQPDGIVTTKTGIIKRAKEKGLFVIQRIFLVDTDMYVNVENSINKNQADIIEMMPCRVAEFISKLSKETTIPIITGGLLNSIEHATQAFDHGAIAVSTSNTEMWKVSMNEII